MTPGSAASTTSVVPDRRGDAFAPDQVPDNYARVLAPAMFEPWARVLIESVGVPPGETVLDVATGTGVVARLAARSTGPTGQVVAADISAAMLTVGGAPPVASDSAPIEWVQAPATNLGLPAGTFGVVLCQQGLPFFTDRLGATREMRRVLRPGGIAGLSVWAADCPLFPFHDYIEVLSAHGVPAPFPGAYDSSSYVMNERGTAQRPARRRRLLGD
ncbi:MAG: class I SAM-dependent methyltransferase [Trebonia sp.]